MKPWYKSKTIIFNILSVAAASVASAVESLRAIMTPEHFALFGVVVGMINVALRVITTEGVSTSKE
jgi:hypothetical protein